mgnify:CR=1 FL=1
MDEPDAVGLKKCVASISAFPCRNQSDSFRHAQCMPAQAPGLLQKVSRRSVLCMLSACLLRHLACCRKSRGDLSSKSSYLLEPRPSRRTPLSDRRLRPLFHITSRIARDHRLQEIRRGHDWIRSSCAPPALCIHKRSALEGQSEARSPGPIACFF